MGGYRKREKKREKAGIGKGEERREAADREH